ncbi:MAG: ATP-dependent DNA helicase RecG [Ignavibacteria bacterium]|nr:ATP-dependent DNA helicase RecG [Ignavibacteria bacterium]
MKSNASYGEIFFYREKQFIPESKYLFWGKVSSDYYNSGIKFDLRDHKKYDEEDDEMLKYPFIPVYILSGELKRKWVKPLQLTKIIFSALRRYSQNISEVLSEEIINSYGLLSHKTAVLRTHYPKNFSDIETSRQTLAFEELFYLQLICALRKKSTSFESGISFKSPSEELFSLFSRNLSFELTNAQKKVIKEISSDMESSRIMNRLLQGDVGSGKTVVAIYAMLKAVLNGYQAAFMCPTEILAEQHYQTLKKYFDKFDVKSAILTGGQKKKLRESILDEIKCGKIQVIVGTHALFQETVVFKELGLVVIDEQHKFGVMQRAKLRGKGKNPDVLVMTATPIPRTLALTVYGDLDVSIIDELPSDRKPVRTGLRYEKDRIKLYEFIREEIRKGRQAYIVYPIIDESENTDLKSAVRNYEILKKDIFPDLRLGLVHGRMFWYEIDDTIEAFRKHEIDILVATTVIEVGIDVPNATVMVIEEAQRFGLSQLHQLRGRVGRGGEQSYCVLMTDNPNSIASERLKIMTETNDGFTIAEEDMKLRGPGEFFGTKQSGELKFTVADLIKDKRILDKAREAAFRIAEDDPQLRKVSNSAIRNFFSLNYSESMNLIKIA